MASRRFVVVVCGAKICVAANPLRSDRHNGPKIASPRCGICTWISMSTERPASIRSRPPIQFPRRPRSSRHRSADIRSSGALTVSLSSSRKAPSNCLRFPLVEIPPARTANGSSACRDSGIAKTIRRIPSPSSTLAIRLRISVTFGWIFRRQMPCLCSMQSHRENTPASTPIPNTIGGGSCTNLPTEKAPQSGRERLLPAARITLSHRPDFASTKAFRWRTFVTLLAVRRRSEIASAWYIRKGPSKDAVESPAKKLSAGVESTTAVRVVKV
jgi:hypothetical protein